MKVHKIFETPLYLYTNETFLKLNKTCDKYIKQAKEWNKTRIKNRKKFYRKDIGDFGLSHPSTTLLGQPKLKDFEEFVGQTSYNILDSQGFNMSKHRVDFTEMWVQEFGAKGGGHQRNHVHHAHISGFYFLKCSDKTSYPVFHDPRPGAMMTKLPFKEKKETMTMTQADVRPKPGDFIFFNSYLPHEFIVDPGIDPFRFIHFNLVALPEKYFEDELSKNKYTVIKNVIPKVLGNFCATYLEMKAYNLNVLRAEKYITKFNEDYGSYGDSQVPDTFSIYGDQAMETLFHFVKPKMEKITKLKLHETYAYARLYKKGDVLKRHKDRMSCEISTTLFLAGDPWPIYVDPKGAGNTSGSQYTPLNNKGVKVDLNPGDMLIYKGCDLEHWRESFKGNICAQVFLHFNDAKNPKVIKNKYDTRPMLGLPSYFRGKGKQ